MNTKEKGVITRTCAPLDFGVHKRFPSKGNRYMFYHFETGHISPMLPQQIIEMHPTKENFEPQDFIDWDLPYAWNVPRNWGSYS